MTPYALPTTLANLWLDTSVQMVRSASVFWGQVLGSPPATDATSTPTRTSTAAPWWKAPDTSAAASPPFDPFAMASIWLPATAPKSATSDAANPWTAAWASWLPPRPASSSTAFANPIEFWQQAWLQNLPQLAALGASFARPNGFAAAWPALLPTAPVAATATPVPAAWQPMMAAYRSANGHAMAAVLRTIADVVEPKSRQADIMPFWPASLGTTRH